jgi:hypothetical protein
MTFQNIAQVSNDNMDLLCKFLKEKLIRSELPDNWKQFQNNLIAIQQKGNFLNKILFLNNTFRFYS